MENYIVRIYRRDDCQKDSLVGLVESVETSEIQSFSTYRELTAILKRSSAVMGATATEKLYFESA